MKVNRRTFLQISAGGVLTTLMSPHATLALSPNRTFRIVLQTGLASDEAFLSGVKADQSHRFSLNVESYQVLVDLLIKSKGHDVLALLEPSDALIVEQAARDSHVRSLLQSRVYQPTLEDRLSWAHGLGVEITNHEVVKNAPRLSDDALVALLIKA